MTYTFDDINPDGSANAGVFTKSEAIDTSQFNSSDGLVRWGFMGATGSNSGANMVVLESVPNLVQASAAVKVTDTTKDKEVASGAKVKAKHKLQYDYKLTYEGGRQDWDNIEADLKLPDNVTFDKAVVKYADGTEQTLDAPAGDTKEVTYQLQSALSSSNPTATITLSGQADNVKINSDTTETTSIFKNRTFETTTTAPNYTITVDQPIEAHFLRAETTVDNGKDATVYGLVIAEGSEQISNSSITIHPTLNGQELDSFKMSDADESGLFIIKIKADQLNVGENKLTAWASDFDDNESEVTETKITVRSGELGFKTVAATSTFKPITLNGQAQTADRNNDWALVVSDERGKGSSWQLQASVSDFTSSDGRKLPGNVLYKQGDQTTVLNGDGTLIDTHTTTSDADNYDVVKDWSNDSGILYKTNAAATPGSYSGKVTWTLTNAPN